MINTGSFLKDQLGSRLLFALVVGLVIAGNVSLVLPQNYLVAGAIVASSALIGWFWIAIDPYFPYPEFEDEPEQRYFYIAFYMGQTETGGVYNRIELELSGPIDSDETLNLVETEICSRRPELTRALVTGYQLLRQEPVIVSKKD